MESNDLSKTCLWLCIETMSSQLLTHWPLHGRVADVTGRWSASGASDVQYGHVGPHGEADTAAYFNGRSSCIKFPVDAPLELAHRLFTLACWVKLSANITTAYGEIFSQFNTFNRCGMSLRITNSSPGYNALSDARNVHFGIDNALDSPWIDHGKPWPGNTLISTLTVYRGHLYTGIADAREVNDAPAVFRFAGGANWEFCGRLPTHPLTRSVQSMIVHKDRLYAGTGNWDWTRAKKDLCGPAQLFVYDGDRSWRSCGLFPSAFRVSCLASFDGFLYAGLDDGHVWRYDDEAPEHDGWTDCGQINNHNRANAMMPFQGHLYVAPHGACFRFEGEPNQWTCIGGNPSRTGKIGHPSFFGENQTHCLRVYESSLWAGLWPKGKAVRYEGDGRWSDRGTLGIDPAHEINEINELTVYNGKLYAGLLPLGEVYRHDRDDQWTMLKRLVHNPDFKKSEDVWSWNRVPCMTVFGGRLFAGTSSCHGRVDSLTPGLSSDAAAQCGRVHSFEAGKNACFDDDLGGDWHHIAAVRDSTELRLYVDGKLVSRSTPFVEKDFAHASGEPLRIGVGPQNYFNGYLSDVRVYAGAIDTAELAKISSRRFTKNTISLESENDAHDKMKFASALIEK